MNQRKLLGVAILSLPVILLLIVSGSTLGWPATFWVFGSFIFVSVCVIVGTHLLDLNF